ncbi:MAG: transporter substrate-binding domain-containing protein [SAR324 cluster bacterium]|nr:transporter substrate-binding domain-containing protein [SAR324 cluster bacterium]
MKVTLWFFGFCFFPLILSAQENLLRTAISNFPPLSYVDDNQKITGVIPETYRIISQELGIPIKIEHYPILRIRSMMQAGILNMYLCAKASEQKYSDFYFYEKPLIVLTTILFQARSEPPLTSIEDLQGKDVLMELGIQWLKNLIPASNSIQASRFSTLHTKLFESRANYLLDIKERMGKVLAQENAFRQYPISQLKSYICLHKNYPDAQSVAKQIYDFFLFYQDTEEGKNLFEQQGFNGRFGE